MVTVSAHFAVNSPTQLPDNAPASQSQFLLPTDISDWDVGATDSQRHHVLQHHLFVKPDPIVVAEAPTVYLGTGRAGLARIAVYTRRVRSSHLSVTPITHGKKHCVGETDRVLCGIVLEALVAPPAAIIRTTRCKTNCYHRLLQAGSFRRHSHRFEIENDVVGCTLFQR
jgi:hypothetical protein